MGLALPWVHRWGQKIQQEMEFIQYCCLEAQTCVQNSEDAAESWTVHQQSAIRLVGKTVSAPCLCYYIYIYRCIYMDIYIYIDR